MWDAYQAPLSRQNLRQLIDDTCFLIFFFRNLILSVFLVSFFLKKKCVRYRLLPILNWYLQNAKASTTRIEIKDLDNRNKCQFFFSGYSVVGSNQVERGAVYE